MDSTNALYDTLWRDLAARGELKRHDQYVYDIEKMASTDGRDYIEVRAARADHVPYTSAPRDTIRIVDERTHTTTNASTNRAHGGEGSLARRNRARARVRPLASRTARRVGRGPCRTHAAPPLTARRRRRRCPAPLTRGSLARSEAAFEEVYAPMQRALLTPHDFAGGVARNNATHLTLTFEMAVPSVSLIVIETDVGGDDDAAGKAGVGGGDGSGDDAVGEADGGGDTGGADDGGGGDDDVGTAESAREAANRGRSDDDGGRR